jgi:Domain of unknown function (DUF397)
MNSSRWNRIPCDVRSCLEWREYDNGWVSLRNSAAPERIVEITPAEWARFIAAAKNGDLDQDTWS